MIAVGYSIDAHEVKELAVALGDAPARLRGRINDAFADEARALEREMKADATGHRYLPAFTKKGGPGFPTTMTSEKVGDLAYDIGFDKEGQGNLANIIVFGSINNGPVYEFYGPLLRRAEPFVERLSDMVVRDIFWGDT